MVQNIIIPNQFTVLSKSVSTGSYTLCRKNWQPLHSSYQHQSPWHNHHQSTFYESTCWHTLRILRQNSVRSIYCEHTAWVTTVLKKSSTPSLQPSWNTRVKPDPASARRVTSTS